MKQGFLRSVLEAMELVVKENGAIVYVENVLLKWLEEYLEDRRKYERYFLPGCSVGFGDANFIYNFESSKKLDYKDCSKGFS